MPPVARANVDVRQPGDVGEVALGTCLADVLPSEHDLAVLASGLCKDGVEINRQRAGFTLCCGCISGTSVGMADITLARLSGRWFHPGPALQAARAEQGQAERPHAGREPPE